jgi:hypothetical protein
MITSTFSNLPKDYIIKKFYEYGYGVIYQKSNDTYHCSCPICLEGRSFGKKKRCWYIPNKNLIYCHNCGWSSRPLKWIMQAGNISYEDVREELNEGEYNIINLDKQDEKDNIFSSIILPHEDELPDAAIDLSNKLQLEYYKGNSVIERALNYINSRRLMSAVNRPKTFYISLSDKTHKNRIVIPFYDFNNKVVFYQSRAIGANIDDFMEDVKYLSKKNAQKSIFNIDAIDDDIEEIFLFEGPIDACFVKNGVAVGGITPSKCKSFTDLQEEQLDMYRTNHRFIWILDSQWIDDASFEKTAILLENGESVFIWPEIMGKKFKDFNEICVQTKCDEVPRECILPNVLSGKSGLLKYKLMMKKR